MTVQEAIDIVTARSRALAEGRVEGGAVISDDELQDPSLMLDDMRPLLSGYDLNIREALQASAAAATGTCGLILRCRSEAEVLGAVASGNVQMLLLGYLLGQKVKR